MSLEALIRPIGSPQTERTRLHRTDCCSALLRLTFEAKTGYLTQAQILTQKAFLLAHMSPSRICHTCHYAFTAMPIQTENQ
ncbi:MAG: hypothetical protein KFB93_07845 [Simkaniaceae bacterium]|jgi:hypothetical protein|nr:MAG: hypothetical protein KFB93_07845 [Simkaniaceae bacterium]